MEVTLDLVDFKNEKEVLETITTILKMFKNKSLMKKINSSDDVYVVKVPENNKIIFRKCQF
jgi:hypothetical protein